MSELWVEFLPGLSLSPLSGEHNLWSCCVFVRKIFRVRKVRVGVGGQICMDVRPLTNCKFITITIKVRNWNASPNASLHSFAFFSPGNWVHFRCADRFRFQQRTIRRHTTVRLFLASSESAICAWFGMFGIFIARKNFRTKMRTSEDDTAPVGTICRKWTCILIRLKWTLAPHSGERFEFIANERGA